MIYYFKEDKTYWYLIKSVADFFQFGKITAINGDSFK